MIKFLKILGSSIGVLSAIYLLTKMYRQGDLVGLSLPEVMFLLLALVVGIFFIYIFRRKKLK